MQSKKKNICIKRSGVCCCKKNNGFTDITMYSLITRALRKLVTFKREVGHVTTQVMWRWSLTPVLDYNNATKRIFILEPSHLANNLNSVSFSVYMLGLLFLSGPPSCMCERTDGFFFFFLVLILFLDKIECWILLVYCSHLQIKNVETMELRLYNEEVSIKSEEIGRFDKLRFLTFGGGTFVGNLMNCFPKLRWIYWSAPGLKCKLTNMCLKNVVVLQFSSIANINDLKLWSLIKVRHMLISILCPWKQHLNCSSIR